MTVEKIKHVIEGADLGAESAVRSKFEGNSSILGSTLRGLKSTLGAYPQGSGERSEYFEGYP